MPFSEVLPASQSPGVGFPLARIGVLFSLPVGTVLELAYNLIRTVIAHAATTHEKHPRQISFTRAMRTMEAFRPTLAHASPNQLPMLYQQTTAIDRFS